jgi:hypothetical protein
MTEGAGPKLITFEHTSAKQLLNKLRREIERIDDAGERAFAQDHVTNAFWTAWSMHQWIWQSFKERPHLKAAVLEYRGIEPAGIDDENSFGSALAGRFVPLKICRAIAKSPTQAEVLVDDQGALSPTSESMRAPNGKTHVLSAVGRATTQDRPMIVVMGKPVSATRLLEEIEQYWVTLIHECGIESLR